MSSARRSFVHRHMVGFAETNFLGTAYFAHFADWQGRCREAFLKLHAPEVLDALARDFRLVTLSMSMVYFDEVMALDEIEIRMWRKRPLKEHRIDLGFEFWLSRDGEWLRVAEGAQEVGCFEKVSGRLRDTPPPPPLQKALAKFAGEEP